MTAYDGYIFFLCFIVFSLFTGVFTVMIVNLVKAYLRLIKLGAEDEKIIIEYKKAKRRKAFDRVFDLISFAFTLLLTAVLLVGCVASTIIGIRETDAVGDLPMLKVVMSSSMASKEPGNKYLFDNKLDDQVQTFDLIVMHKLPAEKELKLYDVVSYEINGQLVLHRIVGIEEPNDKHPDERWFLLQGDAIHVHDKFPVLYKNMRGIYYGERIGEIGSFFVFMRSPAGFLCILLIIFAFVATPIAERKIKAAKDERLTIVFRQPAKRAADREESCSEVH